METHAPAPGISLGLPKEGPGGEVAFVEITLDQVQVIVSPVPPVLYGQFSARAAKDAPQLLCWPRRRHRDGRGTPVTHPGWRALVRKWALFYPKGKPPQIGVARPRQDRGNDDM